MCLCISRKTILSFPIQYLKRLRMKFHFLKSVKSISGVALFPDLRSLTNQKMWFAGHEMIMVLGIHGRLTGEIND